jgi:hypothetical protein
MRGRGILVGVALALSMHGGSVGALQTAPGRGASAAAAVEAWPDAATLAERRQAAENRPLFASTEPVTFSIAADFRTVQRDRNPESTRTYPATLVVARPDGTEASFPMQIRTRGHSRRRPTTCTFAPLRLEFADAAAGTLFEGQRTLKLGVHCRETPDYEQYVLREYAVYRIFNLLTPRSFRARLAKATYVGTDGTRSGPHSALFIEDDDDVARRMEGRIADVMQTVFARVHHETISLLTLFEHMIGNTDFSMSALHNIRLVRTPANVLYPIPYDFDYSGLVNTRYSVPDKRLKIASVRERLYRGPCHNAAALEPFLARLREARPAILAVFDSVPGLDPRYQREAKAYLEQFFAQIDRPGDVKRMFIDGCNRAGM